MFGKKIQVFEEKNTDKKVDALVQLIFSRNLVYNPSLTFLLFPFSLFGKTELFLHKKRINDYVIRLKKGLQFMKK